MKYLIIIVLSLVFSNAGLACEPIDTEKIGFEVGDKIRTIQEFTDSNLGYVEGYVEHIYRTPDNTRSQPHDYTILLAVVNFGGSVYGNGMKVLSVDWLRKFDKTIDPPSYFWAVDEFRRTGILSKPRKDP